MQLFPKILSGMANSVEIDQTAPSGADPDQTAPDLGLYCLHISFCQKLWCSKF